MSFAPPPPAPLASGSSSSSTPQPRPPPPQPAAGDSPASQPSGKSKHHCIIAVRGEPCKACAGRKRACTFEEPPTRRVRKVKILEGEGGEGVVGQRERAKLFPLTYASPALSPAPTPLGASTSTSTSTTISASASNPPPSGLTPLFSLLSSAQLPAPPSPPPQKQEEGGEAQLSLLDVPQMHYLSRRVFDDVVLSLSLPSSLAPGPSHPPLPGALPFHHPSLHSHSQQQQQQHDPVFVQTPRLVYEHGGGEGGQTSTSEAEEEDEGERVWREAERLVRSEMRRELLHLYRRHTHPSLPLFSAAQITSLSADRDQNSPGTLSRGAVLALLAHATTYLPPSRPAHKPLWALALALHARSYTAGPSLETVQVALVILGARPALNVAGNGVGMARLLGAAQLLGLHLDPSRWRLPLAEKRLRKRLWWAVVNEDKWRAVWYGQTSNVNFDDCSVPLPVLSPSADESDFDKPLAEMTPAEALAAEGFVVMCKLSCLIDEILSAFYTLRALSSPLPAPLALQKLSDLAYKLHAVEGGLSPGLRAGSPSDVATTAGQGAGSGGGAKSTQLCLMGVQFLLLRLGLEVVERLRPEDGVAGEEERERRVRDAEDRVGEFVDGVVRWVERLGEGDWSGYWAP
ncbi:hypothetical protein JCM6882_003746, partial [Rhodosporidiobolus microsporus]